MAPTSLPSRLLPALALVAVALAGALAARPAPRADREPGAMPGGMSMSVDWFASHRRAGRASAQPPAAVFTVQNFRFDSDGSAATQVDTVRIQTGQTVLWQWLNGLHTVTDGLGNADPAAGQRVDQPLSTTFRSFAFQFDSAGTYPFFCRYDETANMRCAVIVSSPVPALPSSWGTVKRRYRP